MSVQLRNRSFSTLGILLLALVGLLGACAGGEQVPAPAGAAQGQKTFLYFYTDE